MIIGVTGGLGTGTSTAARCIATSLKANLIVADKIARSQVIKNADLLEQIVINFGKEILDIKGNIDRIKIAKKAFADKASHKKLCGILYPVIIAQISSIIKDINIYDFVVDAPMLIESGFYKKCDELVVVSSSLSLQLERAWTKKGIANKDALARIRLQMPLYKKARYADYIINNGAALTGLRKQCREIADEFKNKKTRRR